MIRALDTLAARTILISLIGVTLVHFLSLWTYERSLERELTLAHETRLAEQIVAIKRSVMLVEPSRREVVAHGLSGGPVEVHWGVARASLPGGLPTERWKGLRSQIAALVPDLGETGLVMGTAGGTDPHLALISMRLPDDSWLNVSVFAAGPPRASGHGAVISTTLMALGVILLSIVVARWLARPIRSVADAARSLAPDAATIAVPEQGPREVRDLAKSFNDMQRRISDLVARRTQALAAVSHDLRTPLTRLRLRTEDLSDSAVKNAVDRDIGEMEQMIDATLSYLRGDEAAEVQRPLDLTALLGTIVDDARDADNDVSLVSPHHIVIRGRLIGLRRAFSNLVGNAVRFGSTVSVTVSRAEGAIIVAVEDNGPGIPEDQLGAVLEPFVRLEQSRNRETGGVGLGLTIAKSHIEADGGRLVLSNRASGGLRAVAMIPYPAS